MCELCKRLAIFFLVALFVAATVGTANAGFVITFEGLADGDVVTNQFSGQGVTFGGQTIALQAGLSLNDFDFPPKSGVNVVSSDLGQITAVFGAPQASVGAFFTHASPVTITAFDAQNVVVGTGSSGVIDNTISSGNAPNEFIGTTSVTGITSVTITGAPGEFTVDDLTFTAVVTTEPDLTLVSLGLLALGAAAAWRRLHPARRSR